MNKRSLESLEYNKIRDRVAKQCRSALGQELVEEMEPMTDSYRIQEALDETEDAVEVLLKYPDPPLFGIRELGETLKRAERNGILLPRQILDVADMLRCASELVEYAEDKEMGKLTEYISLLYRNDSFPERVERVFINEEEIADTASNTLFSLRKSKKAKMEQVRKKLDQILVSESKYLQDAIVTIREGRYVVPVRSEHKRKLPGVVHDQSSSGQTVFIEPMAVVELNNQIRQIELDEDDEIRRILLELSGYIKDMAPRLEQTQMLLAHLDFQFAKAKYALETDATKPVLSKDRVISLKEARHPLLKGKVVPINVELGKDYTTLIITGPNTGGKTVSLKTVGLLTMMAQSGLFIPAASRSVVGVFREIHADIGDKQSIEMSLSTFSASMTNIVRIMDEADEESLVLFDELGAGTDPTEGAALAMAILDRLTQQGIRVMVTTHYAELKLYATETPGVQNASVEFDVNTLRPTYRLMTGLPGKSNAFEISARLGLQKDLLARARKFLSGEKIRFEKVLSEIEEDRLKIRAEREEMERERKEYLEQNKKLQEELEKSRKAGEREREEAMKEATRILDEANETAQELLKEAKRAKRGSTVELDRKMTDIREKYQDQREQYEVEEEEVVRTDSKPIRKGDRVKVLSLNQVGRVATEPDKDGEVSVQVGILRMTVTTDDLVKLEDKPEEEKPQRSSGIRKLVRRKAQMDISPELDLRGARYDEAISRVDKYIDDCIIVGLPRVTIIHGKGTGALRKGIHEYLKKHPQVASFKLGNANEGGAGVTVVEFKK